MNSQTSIVFNQLYRQIYRILVNVVDIGRRDNGIAPVGCCCFVITALGVGFVHMAGLWFTEYTDWMRSTALWLQICSLGWTLAPPSVTYWRSWPIMVVVEVKNKNICSQLSQVQISTDTLNRLKVCNIFYILKPYFIF